MCLFICKNEKKRCEDALYESLETKLKHVKLYFYLLAYSFDFHGHMLNYSFKHDNYLIPDNELEKSLKHHVLYIIPFFHDNYIF